MSFRVLRLKEIKGQPSAIKLLFKALENRQLPHAYLFVGPEGVGKETTAWGLFFQLVCEKKEACGQCLSCRKFLHRSHPDVELIVPQGQNIKINQIRELEHKLNFRPLEAEYRLILISQAERMTREAANALLKSLEEPPPYNLFVLISPSTEILLPTIVSRSQIVRFRPLTPKIVAQILQEEFEKLPEEAETLAFFSQGSIAKALKLGEKGFLQELERFSRSFRIEDPYFILSVSENLSGNRENLEMFLEMVLIWFRASLWFYLCQTPYPPSLPEPAPASICLSAMAWIEEAFYALKANAHRELILLDLLLKLRELWERSNNPKISSKGATLA